MCLDSYLSGTNYETCWVYWVGEGVRYEDFGKVCFDLDVKVPCDCDGGAASPSGQTWWFEDASFMITVFVCLSRALYMTSWICVTVLHVHGTVQGLETIW